MRRLVIWLVHGTRFGAPSKWPQPGSLFRDALRAALGRTGEYRVFRWSGKNAHTDRIRAGRELSRALKEAIDEDPTAKHYVIAHSHGGNALMYAIRALGGVPPQLIGASTMGTPFIRILRRPVPRRVRLVSTVVAIVLAILLV